MTSAASAASGNSTLAIVLNPAPLGGALPYPQTPVSETSAMTPPRYVQGKVMRGMPALLPANTRNHGNRVRWGAPARGQ
jgi:hypothetical protein